MKIAIKGHASRGKEVIQILESLGGKNTALFKGNQAFWYFINSYNNIVNDYEFVLTRAGFKTYTLEEFEKEFPFKIGDIILSKATNNPYEIVALEWFNNKLCYKLDNGFHYAPKALTTYKEMKEERNITLTLDKAREWYNKGGELKEIALQAFSEKELTKVKLPETWEEFCNTHPTKEGEYYIDNCSDISSQCESTGGRDIEMDKNVCPSQKSAEAHLAMIQLEQLRDCYRGLFVTVIGMPIWNISMYNGKPHIFQAVWGKNQSFLSFQSRKVAEEYLENFEPLIEKAGDLI